MSEMIVDLKGRRALVTGAGRGIGRAIAVALGRSGADVIVNYHSNAKAAEETVREIRSAGRHARAIQADVGREADVERIFSAVREHFGDRLDILVNNAGGTSEKDKLDSMTAGTWSRCLAVNLDGVFYCTRAAVPLLPDGTSRIINVTSISARTGGGPEMTHYAAVKGAVSNFTRACAKELGPRGITVNGIAPGVIYTDLHKLGTAKEELEMLKERTPLGRLGDAEDCAGAVLFLCSRQAAYITGEIIEINGGLMMN